MTLGSKLLEYIDSHLDDNLTIDLLSSIVGLSKYHFHRQFYKLFGINVYKYVQLNRLKRASYQLAFRDHIQIVDISLLSGYQNHESFSRAFRKSMGQTPFEFRKCPQWDSWHSNYEKLSELRSKHMESDNQSFKVEIITFKDTKVAVKEHRGAPNLIGDSIRKFIEWRKQNNLSPKVSATFNILYDNPFLTPPDKYRFDICASTTRDVANNSFGVVSKSIPGGRCALIRHIGNDTTIIEKVNYLYSTWLPLSGEELREFPLFLQRVSFFPDVLENEAITDLFLPLK